MLNPFQHIHNLNSVIKDRHQLLKSHNEIFGQNSLERRLSIGVRQERHPLLKMHRVVKT